MVRKNSLSKVDYRLLQRRRISSFLDSLKDKQHTVKEMDTHMKMLFSMGKEVIPVCLNKLKEEDIELVPIICYAIKYADDYKIVPSLVRILMSENLSDTTKTEILGVLAEYGYDISSLPLKKILDNFEKMASDSMDRMLDNINRDNFFISFILEDFETFSQEMQLEYVKDVGNAKDERALPLLESVAELEDSLVAKEAVKQIGRIYTGKALNALKNILKKIDEKSKLKEFVETEIRRLQMRGIKEDVKKSMFFEIHNAHTTSIDGEGNRIVLFLWKHPEDKRKLCSINILINVSEGIKDCWALPETSNSEYKETLKEIQEESEVIGDYSYAIKIFKDALYKNREKGIPIPKPLAYWNRFFDAPDLIPEKIDISCIDQQNSLDIELIENDKLFKRALDAFQDKELYDWFILSNKAYDIAEEYNSFKGFYIKNRKLYKMKMNKLIRRFINNVIIPDREKINQMLLMTYDFYITNMQKTKCNTIEYIYFNLQMDPLECNPLFKRICKISIDKIVKNINKGIDIRNSAKEDEY